MKPTAVWVIIISYLLVSVGLLIDNGCCHDEHGDNTVSQRRHYHICTNAHAAVHAIAHVSPPNIHPLLAKKYCCVSGGQGLPYEACQPLGLTQRPIKTSELLHKGVTPATVNFSMNSRLWSCFVSCGSVHAPSAHTSIPSTVLLI